MKILTFNHHESYISLLAQTGHEFHVVTRKNRLDLSWAKDRVSPASNIFLCAWDHNLEKRLKAGEFDLVIAHTIKNLLWLMPFRNIRMIFIAHIPLFTASLKDRVKGLFKRRILETFMRSHRCQFVAVSDWKLSTWKLSGRVIEPTPKVFPPLCYPEKASEIPYKIVLVCNHIKQRKHELGWPIVQKLLEEVPLVIIGENPEVPQSIKMKNFAQFQDFLQSFTIYFYPIQRPHGDGYNLGLLEAMGMGMVPVTLYNPSSPVRHMENGLVAHSFEELKTCFEYLKLNPLEIKRMGLAAKETVHKQFSKELFIEKWQKTILDFS